MTRPRLFCELCLLFIVFMCIGLALLLLVGVG